MKKNPGLWTLIWAVLFFGALSLVLLEIDTLINNESTEFDVGETRTMTVDEANDYYVMFNDQTFLENGVSNVTYSSNYTTITFDMGDQMSLRIKNASTNDYYYIDALNDNTTISLNEFIVIGTITLDPGVYEMDATMLSGHSQFSLKVQEVGIIGSILTIVFSSIVSVVSIIGFFVSFSHMKKQQEDDVEFDGFTYPQQNINELFDIDDDYFSNQDDYSSDDK